MNEKGQSILGIMFFLVAVAFMVITVPVIKSFLDDMRAPPSTNQNGNEVMGLDCSNSSISSSTAVTCTGTDLTLPLFVGAVLAAGLGAIFSRLGSVE